MNHIRNIRTFKKKAFLTPYMPLNVLYGSKNVFKSKQPIYQTQSRIALTWMTNRTWWAGYILLMMGISLLRGQSTNFAYQKVREGGKGIGKNMQVEAIIQDKFGFIWAGFLDGLVRYDGYHTKEFVHDPKDTTSLSANFIHSLYGDSEGNIWASTRNGGIDKIDGTTEQITRYSKGLESVNKGYFTTMTSLGENQLLLGGNLGLYTLDKETGVFEQLDTTAYCRVIHPFQDSLFLIINEIGLRVYHPMDRSFSKINDPVLSQADSLLRTVNDLLIDKWGMYWFASTDYGVLRYDPQNQRLTRFCESQEIGCPGGVFTIELVEDHLGNIWVAGKEGLRKYDREANQFVALKEKEQNSKSLLSNRLKRLLIDRNDNLWIGNKKGLYISRLKVEKFQSYFHIEGDSSSLPNKPIFSLHIDTDDDLWVPTYGGGLVRMSIPDGRITTYTRGKERTPGRLFSDDLLSVMESSDQTLWVGSEVGLHSARRTGNKELSFTFHPNPLSGETYVYHTLEREDHKLWVGTPRGLYVFDPQTTVFSAYPAENSIEDAVLFIRQDGPILWVGTARNGMISYHTETKERHQYLADPRDSTAISNNRVNHIQRDPGGWYWVSTSIGLNLFDPEARKFQTFLETDGLPGNYLNAVLLDAQGNLWASLLDGTSKIDLTRKSNGQPVIQRIHNYFEEDGMGASGYNFGAYTQRQNGEIFLAGSGVVTSFNPEEITLNSLPANTLLTGFDVLNEPWKDGYKISALKEIKLDHYQNFFSVSFSSFDFLTPDNVHYAYKLEGVDEDWVYTDKEYSGYTKVNSGNYVFHVKATNRDGIWGPVTHLKIAIKSPFWLSWWFLSFVATVIGGLGYLIFVLRTRQIYSHRARKLAEQSAQHKAAFLANMSHEIRTPMNAVVGATHLIEHTALDAKQKHYIEMIRQSAENLLVIVNDILDFSKIEAGKLSFIQKPFNVREVAEYVRSTLSHRATENNTDLKVTCADEVPEILVGDATRLNQILLNLGSNAVKFTQEGTVEIELGGRLEQGDKWGLTISVKDTGIGIAEEHLKTIFESFAQGEAEVSHKFGGTGLGLSIAQRLVVDQGGEIKVKSEVDKGTTFWVKIPFSIGENIKPQELADAWKTDESVAENIKLLLVEDNHINREIAMEIIQEMIPFAQIDTAHNGQEALSHLTGGARCDLILMDIKMPVMDGYTCTQTIREQLPPPISRTPIIALTATATDEEIQKCLEVGMNDFVSKPFDPITLRDKILKLRKKKDINKSISDA